jgi:hypothetical protein
VVSTVVHSAMSAQPTRLAIQGVRNSYNYLPSHYAHNTILCAKVNLTAMAMEERSTSISVATVLLPFKTNISMALPY